MTLPERASVRLRSATSQRQSTGKIRILLADDDREVRIVLSSGLRKDGHEVIEVGSGHELLEYLGMSGVHGGMFAPPDLVISDIRMPGFSGLDVLTGIFVTDWPVPVILITGFGDDETHRLGRTLGALAVFDKPFDVDDLRSFVRELDL